MRTLLNVLKLPTPFFTYLKLTMYVAAFEIFSKLKGLKLTHQEQVKQLCKKKQKNYFSINTNHTTNTLECFETNSFLSVSKTARCGWY